MKRTPWLHVLVLGQVIQKSQTEEFLFRVFWVLLRDLVLSCHNRDLYSK